MARRITDGMQLHISGEDQIAIEAMFPMHKNKFQMLQAITEHTVRAQPSLAVLGLLRRCYSGPAKIHNASEVLSMFQEELNINKIAQERKGRLELAEIVAAGKRAKGEGEEE